MVYKLSKYEKSTILPRWLKYVSQNPDKNSYVYCSKIPHKKIKYIWTPADADKPRHLAIKYPPINCRCSNCGYSTGGCRHDSEAGFRQHLYRTIFWTADDEHIELLFEVYGKRIGIKFLKAIAKHSFTVSAKLSIILENYNIGVKV